MYIQWLLPTGIWTPRTLFKQILFQIGFLRVLRPCGRFKCTILIFLINDPQIYTVYFWVLAITLGRVFILPNFGRKRKHKKIYFLSGCWKLKAGFSQEKRNEMICHSYINLRIRWRHFPPKSWYGDGMTNNSRWSHFYFLIIPFQQIRILFGTFTDFRLLSIGHKQSY